MAAGSSNAAVAAQQSDTPQALKSWWSNFKKKGKKEPTTPGPPQPGPGDIFNVPLSESIKYANVAISLMQEDGSSYTYGYIPIVVAKCGVFLKDKATDVGGIFRLAGSARRTNELQKIFNTPDKYGKGLDWDGYTVHDAANVLRRFLNALPEPIVPLHLYEPFREPLRQHQFQAVGNVEGKDSDIGNFDYDATIVTYRDLITRLPPLNRQLLLYILDMLAIFAAKSATNQMNAANLAVIFQPGMLHHPDHDQVPAEYRLSQDVVIFLIDQQDNFLLGMAGTAADEKTKKEIEAGPPASPATPTRAAAGLGRSVSTTSRSTNSSRLAGIRRNLSVSSRGSRASVIAAGPGTPGTPGAPGTPGVHRSNTVPSRKSPAVSQSRFNKPSESPNNTPPMNTPDMTVSPPPQSPAPAPIAAVTGSIAPSPEPRTDSIAPSVNNATAVQNQSKERLLGADGAAGGASANKPRNALTNLLRSPGSDDGRQPNKLRKKRQPQGTGVQPSGHSSATSLSGADPVSARSPPLGPVTGVEEGSRHVSGASNGGFEITDTAATPRGDLTPQPVNNDKGKELAPLTSTQTSNSAENTHHAVRPEASEASVDRYDTSTGNEFEGESGVSPDKERKRRWRFSVSAKKNHEDRHLSASHGSTSHLGGYSDADLSKTSSGSWRHRRSSTNVADVPTAAELNAEALRQGSRDHAYTSEERSPTNEAGSSKGPIGWFKRKIKEREEKEAEKERAKSPRRSDVGRGPSSQNLDAAVNGDPASRQVSTDLAHEPLAETVEEHRAAPNPLQTAPLTTNIALDPSTSLQEIATPTQAIPEPSLAGVVSDGHPTNTLPIVSGKIEDYMNDSDREKLLTAREAAKRQSTGQATGNSTIPQPADISIDPNYKVEAGKGNITDPEPTTPKASEANAGLAPRASTAAPSHSVVEEKTA